MSREESKLAEAFKQLLYQAVYAILDIHEGEAVLELAEGDPEDDEWDEGDEEYRLQEYQLGHIQFSDRMVPESEVRFCAALVFSVYM